MIDEVEKVVTQLSQERIQAAVLGYMEQAATNGIPVSPEQALAEIEASGENFSPDADEIREIALKLKGAATSVIRKRATVGAKRIEREIHDLMVETGFADELLQFIHDYDTYPFAVMRTGFHIPFTRRIWKGNKWVERDQNIPYAKRVSPWNFYWTPDSLTVDDGTAVGDVVYLRRVDLERMYQFEDSSEIKNNIRLAVSKCNSFTSARDWLRCLGVRKENEYEEESSPWEVGVTVPVFRISALVDACTMREFGLQFGEDLSQYEVEAWILDREVVRFKIHDPKGFKRPYAVDKFRHLPGKFQGHSLAGILKPTEHKTRIRRAE